MFVNTRINKALIEDRLALRRKHADKADEAAAFARDALTDHQLAKNSESLNLIVSNQADARMGILKTYFPELASEVPDVQEDPSIGELLKYLASSASDSE